MKWKEFKQAVEARGVRDDTEVVYQQMNFGGNDGPIEMHRVIVDVENNVMLIESNQYPDLE